MSLSEITGSDVVIERLKAYSAEDAAGIGRLMPFLSSSRTAKPMNKELLEEIIDSPHHEQLIARLNGTIVGVATLSILMGPAVNKAAYLEDFVTDPDVRGKGIGSLMWDEIIRWCDERNVRLDFTSKPTRKEAHDFYIARGAQVRETTVFRVDAPKKGA